MMVEFEKAFIQSSFKITIFFLLNKTIFSNLSFTQNSHFLVYINFVSQSPPWIKFHISNCSNFPPFKIILKALKAITIRKALKSSAIHLNFPIRKLVFSWPNLPIFPFDWSEAKENEKKTHQHIVISSII